LDQHVAHVEFDRSLCRTFSDANMLVAEFDTVYEPAYNAQYSVPLSTDGQLLYVPTWSRGLFCYDTHSGALVWRQGPGKVCQVEVVEDSLVIEMADRGIYVRDARTGRLVKEVKLASIQAFIRVSPTELFAGPKRNRYHLLDLPSLHISHEIPGRTLNPRGCLSFIVLEAHLTGDALVVSGWEQYPDGNYEPPGEPERFTRGIFLRDSETSRNAGDDAAA
jgi:hypothetical protein